MKRTLFDSVKALPYTPGEAADRTGALSAILAIHVADADPDAKATITLTHCDTEDGAFEDFLDDRLFRDETEVEMDAKGQITAVSASIPIAVDDLLNVDIDLLGCKRYICVEVECTGSADTSCVLVLGDYDQNPPG